MAGFFRIVKVVSVIILMVILLNSYANIGLNPILTVEGSTLTGITDPSNKETISGDYTFRVEDQGDSSRCELYIDGILVTYMNSSSGGWDWESTVGTYAWSDGWHVVRFDAKDGASGNDSKSIFVKFDNNAPGVTNIQTLYPRDQTACKPEDVVTIIGTVTETTSGITSVVCDTSFISETASQVMYDDGNHFDGLSGDGTYGTPLITVTNELIGYHPVYITPTDGAGNTADYPGEVGIDTIDPQVEDVNVIYPKGQYSAKDGDQVRITAYINDEDPTVDIVLDIDRSGSMGWTEDNKWLFQDIDVSSIADNKSQVKIRFSYDTDFSWRFSGWNVDDLKLVSDQSPNGFYNSNFETSSGLNNWLADVGSEWVVSGRPRGSGGSGTGFPPAQGNPDPSSAYQGIRVMGVDFSLADGNYEQGVGPYYVTSPTINAVGHTNVHLTYYRWLNADYPGTAPDYKPVANTGDEHTVEISNNAGTNYTTIWDNKQQKLEDGKSAAKILVNHQGENDRSALYSFGSNTTTFVSEVTRDSDWTTNKTQIKAAIDNLNAYGATPLWDSVVSAANYAGSSDTLKALVVLTDGSDTGSSNTLNDAIRTVRSNEVPTFTIALGTNSTEAQLKALASAYPGGSYYFAASSDQLDKIYEDISNAIENIRFPKGAIKTYVNATQLGGLSKVLMYDDGFHDDFLANDNIYGSDLITISTNGETGKIPFEVKVEDVAGRTDTSIGLVLVDNSIISITNTTVIYPGNKTNVRDAEDIFITANITDPHGIYPPQPPNGISSVYVDAFNIGASSHIDMFDDGNHSDNNASDGLFGSESITVTTGYAIGTFIVMIHAYDNASNTASQQLNVNVDNSAPTSTNLIWPIDNMTLEGTVKIQAGAYDDAGIDEVEIEIAQSSIWDKMTYSENTGNYELYYDTTTLSDGGPYKIIVRAFDNSGEAPAYDELSFGFFVDNTDPVLTINAPRNGDFVTGNFEINVSYYDPGLFKPFVEYKIDDTEWQQLNTTDGTYWTAVWDTSSESDGTHTVSFKANDTIGNSIQYSISVFIDNNAPTCKIVAPSENEYVQGKYTFKVLATDTVGMDDVVITYMDENHSALYNPQNGYYEYTIDTILVEEGARTIDAEAVDLVGRTTAADQVIFHIDNSAPRITIKSPTPGSYVEGEIYIDVSSSDVYLAITEYKIDGTKWVSTAVPWDTTAVLDGPHTIDIRSYDLLQHETTETIVVTVDNNEPTIAIHSPSYSQFVESTFTFKVTAWDYIGIDRVELTLFNQTVFATLNTQTNYYEYTFSSLLYDDGTYDVKATVYDLSGKSKTTNSIQFFIDNNEPTLVLVSPEGGEIIKGDLVIDVLSDDAFLDKVEYRIDKGGYVDILTRWDTLTLTDGDHTITVRALDEAGHETTFEFDIIVDNNPPELSFAAPLPDQYYAGYLNVRISTSDSVGIDSVQIKQDDSKTPIEIFKNPESGLYETTIDTSILFDGEHSVSADVIDKNGFVTSKKLTFYTDNTGPDINVIYPGSTGSGDILFKFNVTDISGVKQVFLNIDSSGWREITLAQLTELSAGNGEITEVYTFNYFWSTLPEDNGNHLYVVKAIDNFGNEELYSREIEVKNIVKKKVEEPDYLGMINTALPLIIFITALIIIIIIIFLFYQGTLQRWYSEGQARAGKQQRPLKKKLMKKKLRRSTVEDYDEDMETDEYDEMDEDYGPIGPAGRDYDRQGPRRVPKKPMKRAPRRRISRRKPIEEDEGESIDWD